jgi:hypothetical protein
VNTARLGSRATVLDPVRGRTVRLPGAGANRAGQTRSKPVLTGLGRNSRPSCHRNVRSSGSSAGKRRPEPHGHKSFRPSFSTSSVSTPTMRLPRLTRDSLEGTPGGACWLAQKDASASSARYMIVLPHSDEHDDHSQPSAATASRFPAGRTAGHQHATRQIRMFARSAPMHKHTIGRLGTVTPAQRKGLLITAHTPAVLHCTAGSATICLAVAERDDLSG